MINGIIGKKVGMTQLFAADGTVTPVTVIKAGPCVVVQKKTAGGKDGYDAVQLGLVEDRPIKLKNVKTPAEMQISFKKGVLEMHCAYALRTDGMYSDNEIRELLVKNL